MACPISNCNDVLNSPYGTIFNLPLPLFGCLAYLTMAGLALGPKLFKNPKTQFSLEQLSWGLMFGLGTAMAICSSYLIYLLAFELRTFCFYCALSAIFSFSLFLLTLVGRSWEDIGQLLFQGLAIGMVTLIGVLGVYNTTQATEAPPITGFQITNVSSPAGLSLAHHLQSIGAKQYGAYWCPHCQQQKQLFGKAAFDLVNYVECDPQGPDPQPQLCRQLGITSYPTWEIQGKFYSGLQSLEALADLSGYQGEQDFQG